MTEWFEASAPAQLYWSHDPHFWRTALIARARAADPRAFSGPNQLRAYPFRSTLRGIIPDLVMVMADAVLNEVTLVLFPSFLGATIGNDSRSIGLADTPAEAAERDKANEAEQAAARRAGLTIESIPGPDGASWRVFLKSDAMSASELLAPDGNTLTPTGHQRVESFVREVLTAVGQWVARSEEDRAVLASPAVEVGTVSVIKGNPLV